MVIAVQSAKSHLPPDYHAELDGQFSPGILNTVVFLVSSVQQVTVFFVNIQGYPFMTGMTDNSPLLWSLAGTFVLVFMFASESVSFCNERSDVGTTTKFVVKAVDTATYDFDFTMHII